MTDAKQDIKPVEVADASSKSGQTASSLEKSKDTGSAKNVNVAAVMDEIQNVAAKALNEANDEAGHEEL